jgi:hypothetical protein
VATGRRIRAGSWGDVLVWDVGYVPIVVWQGRVKRGITVGGFGQGSEQAEGGCWEELLWRLLVNRGDPYLFL